MSVSASTFVPDVLFLVDRSGSMLQPLNPADPMCRGCTTNCPAGCTLRSTALLSNADRFFTTNTTAGRYGLVLFPSNGSCGPPTQVASPLPMSDDPSVLSMMAAATMTQLRSASLSGGTPTSQALQFSLATTGLANESNRDHFLVLVTDGLPNCNPMNANTCMTPNCRCTTGQCSGQSCTLGCLDRQETLDALVLARAKDVRTLVIGFANDVNLGSGPQLFDELGRAGAPLACPTAGRSECGANNPCRPDGTCTRAYSNELGAGFDRVAELIKRSKACRWTLDQPVADGPGFEVRVNGLVVSKGAEGWQAENPSTVRFGGAVCEVLAQPNAQVPVSFTLLP